MAQVLPGKEEDMIAPATNSTTPPKEWVRGVNIGGWLVLERYITPYQVRRRCLQIKAREQ
jgi:hypothetical protein